MIEPGHERANYRGHGGRLLDHAYFTADPREAQAYARNSRADGVQRVYQVEPTGGFEADEPRGHPDYRSKSPLRVLQEVWHDTAWESDPNPLAQEHGLGDGRTAAARHIAAEPPRPVTLLRNPYHGTPEFGGRDEWAHTWFHGTRGEPDFGDRRGHAQDELSKPPGERQMRSGWAQPNQLLGVHFSPLHEVAHKFAGGGISSTPSAIAHAQLHFSNPAVYDSEDHLNIAMADWAGKHYPHWHDDKLNGSMAWNYSDQEGTHRDFSHVPEDHRERYRLAQKAQSLLQWHPHMPEILNGFTRHLREQGHHGIIYGNDLEGPYLTDATRGGEAAVKYQQKNEGMWGKPRSFSAIARPEDIHVTHVERISPWREDPQGDQRTWEDASDSDEPDEMRDKILDYHREHGGRLPARLASGYMPSSGIFAPTTGFDSRLFDDRHELRGAVREAIMERIDRCIRVDVQLAGSDWQDWMKVYIAGGSASEWAGGRPNDAAQDLDVLVGIDLPKAQGYNAFEGMDASQAATALNAAFRKCFNDPEWHAPFGGVWGLTAYCNPGAYDITAIKPYAAYDVTDMKWTVKPPHLPEHSLADFDPATLAHARAVLAEARAILRMPEPLRTREAKDLWAHIHAHRCTAFGPGGTGWQDVGNIDEKWLAYAPGNVLGKIRELALPAALPKTAGQESWVYYHGTPDERTWQTGGSRGLHVGSEEAARQALNARIGRPLEGDWDGTREYGKTLLSPYQVTGEERNLPEPRYPSGNATYSNGEKVPMDARPNIFPVRITGPMTNHPALPVEDDYANARMKGQITRGHARRGYFYRNIGEDEGSISAVVPSAAHLERIEHQPKTAAVGSGASLGELYHSTPYASGFPYDEWMHLGTRPAAEHRALEIRPPDYGFPEDHPTTMHTVRVRGRVYPHTLNNEQANEVWGAGHTNGLPEDGLPSGEGYHVFPYHDDAEDGGLSYLVHRSAIVPVRTETIQRRELSPKTAAAVPGALGPGESQLDTREWEGRTGDPTHITRSDRGLVPTSAIAGIGGVEGEAPGAHRNRQGQEWDDFKADIAANGIRNPIFITKDWDKPAVLSEGNHRRDAAVELGLTHVPVEIRYFGHAERQGLVHEHAPKTAAAKPAVTPAGPLYHGSMQEFAKGTVLTPDGHDAEGHRSKFSGDYVYATTNPEAARYFGSMHDSSPLSNGDVHVHRVEPVGELEPDEFPAGAEDERYREGNYRAKALRVVDHYTVPGHWSKTAVRDDEDTPCVDCGTIVSHAQWAPGKQYEHYMVHDRLWEHVGNPKGYLCTGCLENRLGRQLNRHDFKEGLGVNSLSPEYDRYAWSDRTPRLIDRLTREAKKVAVRSGDHLATKPSELPWGDEEWASARREPWHAAAQLAQEQARWDHPRLSMPFPHGEEGDQMVGHILGYVGYGGDASGAFVARHPHPERGTSNPSWLGRRPGVALHPDKWDYGTVIHEAAHHAVMHAHAIGPNEEQPDEQVHGPEWASHYAQGLNKMSPGAGDDFLGHHQRYRDMIAEGLQYKRPRDLDAADARRGLTVREGARDPYQTGLCGTYAVGLMRLKPGLRMGVAGDEKDDDNCVSPDHYFAHDDTHAYDSKGRHPLPYSGRWKHSELDAADPWVLEAEHESEEDAEDAIAKAQQHAIKHKILDLPTKEAVSLEPAADASTIVATAGTRNWDEPPEEAPSMHREAAAWDPPWSDYHFDPAHPDLEGMHEVARHSPDFKTFLNRNILRHNYHGRYWHLTHDPDFKIRSDYAPQERSSMGSENEEHGLMVSTDPEAWHEDMPHRQYAAEIALHGKPGEDYEDTSRGFGHEIWVNSPHKAEVLGVYPYEEGMRKHNHFYSRIVPSTEEDFRQIWDRAHGTQKTAASGYEGLGDRSAMIYLEIPDGLVHQVQDGVDDHHVTICYLGKDVDDGSFAEACRRAEQVANGTPPLECLLHGIDTFPASDSSDGKIPAFVPAYIPGIGKVRQQLEDLSASEHRQYKPHVTLGYYADGEELPPPHPPVKLTIGKISVKRGDDVVSYPFRGR